MDGDGVIDIRTGRPMVTRRGLLRGILAAGVAPAITPLQGLADGVLRRGLGARLAAMGEVKSLPYDEELEYLESNANQYIDTGYIPTVNTGFCADVQRTMLISGDNLIMGVVAPSTCIGFNGSYSSFFYAGQNYMDRKTTTSDFYVFGVNVANDRIATLNGIALKTFNEQSVAFSRSVYVFASNFGVIYAKSGVRMRSARVFENGVMVMDFKPVLKNGIPCLYDCLSNGSGFYYNRIPGHQFGYKQYGKNPIEPY